MDRLLDRVIVALATIAGALLCTLTLLICVDVLVRYGGWFSLRWTLDVAEYHLYLITFLAAPWVLLRNGHIAVDLLVQRLSLATARRLAWLGYAIGAAVCSVLLIYSLKVLWASYSAGTLIYKALIMPEWPLFLVPPLSFALMLAVFARWLFGRVPPPGAGGADGL